jgi:CMP-N-acetylneuraminic acid synthetase
MTLSNLGRYKTQGDAQLVRVGVCPMLRYTVRGAGDCQHIPKILVSIDGPGA